jgi:hypothetical protein
MTLSAQQAVEAITALQAEVSHLRARINELSTLPSRPKPRLPDPEKLTGSTRWDTWLPLIRAKLRIDRQAIGPELEALFYYVYGNLDPRIQLIVLPQLHTAEEA